MIHALILISNEIEMIQSDIDLFETEITNHTIGISTANNEIEILNVKLTSLIQAKEKLNV